MIIQISILILLYSMQSLCEIIDMIRVLGKLSKFTETFPSALQLLFLVISHSSLFLLSDLAFHWV